MSSWTESMTHLATAERAASRSCMPLLHLGSGLHPAPQDTMSFLLGQGRAAPRPFCCLLTAAPAGAQASATWLQAAWDPGQGQERAAVSLQADMASVGTTGVVQLSYLTHQACPAWHVLTDLLCSGCLRLRHVTDARFGGHAGSCVARDRLPSAAREHMHHPHAELKPGCLHAVHVLAH